jgi:adenylate kinase family enzyme
MPNVFLIGRPGCGKSVVFRIIEEQLRAKGFKGELRRIDDFPLLKHIFDTDVEHKRHRPAPGGGLKVTDDTVWDDLAKGLNDQALKLQSPDRLLFIEFSRDNYIRAFKNFSPRVLKNSLILYIDAPFDVCWERNARRVRKEKGLDAHLVSREEMEKTYARDDHEDLPKHISTPVLEVKNDSDDLGRLREELRKVVGRLEKDFLRRR